MKKLLLGFLSSIVFAVRTLAALEAGDPAPNFEA